MPALKNLIPNIWVADMSRSVAFYTERLGFSVAMAVPDKPPYVWARLLRDDVAIDLNNPETAAKDYPGLSGKPLGATAVLFIEVEGVRTLHDELKSDVAIVMPLIKQFYGATEFAIADPDGYVITFAEH